MKEPQNLEAIMKLILNGGSAKGNAMEAIQQAKEGAFDEAEVLLAQGEQDLLEAHHAQTELLTKEASGESSELSLLMVHGQDHLMTSMTFLELAKEVVSIYKKMAE